MGIKKLAEFDVARDAYLPGSVALWVGLHCAAMHASGQANVASPALQNRPSLQIQASQSCLCLSYPMAQMLASHCLIVLTSIIRVACTCEDNCAISSTASHAAKVPDSLQQAGLPQFFKLRNNVDTAMVSKCM